MNAGRETTPPRAAPPPPPWVAAANTLGPSAGGDRFLVPIESDELIATAIESCGLDDFGPDGWQQHFDVLVPELNDSPLHTMGRLLARSELLRCLRNRLLLAAHRAAHPRVGEQDVVAPVFVVGTARSGTSITHELLGCDPANRMPTTWQVLHPVEAATARSTDDTDWRAVGDGEVTLWHHLRPEYKAMHFNGGDLPTECIFLTMNEFLSDQWSGTHEIPGYAQHLQQADHRPAYALHRQILQVLQADRPGARWALKAPSHLATLDALFDVYPDARIIFLHRDPLETIPSTLSLMATLKSMRNTRVDIESIAATLPYGYEWMLRSMLDRRASGDLPDAQFHDVRFPQLGDDPAAAVKEAYDHFGLPFSERLRADITSYAADKPRGTHGRHRYSLADFGLDEAAERRRFEFYTDRFDLLARSGT